MSFSKTTGPRVADVAAGSSSDTEPSAGRSCLGGDVRVQPAAGEGSLYGQFCPVAMAAEVLATRWTLVVLGEMLSGSTRYSDIRRGVPKMSSALLSKRLRELEQAGVLTHLEGEYQLTRAGLDLAPIIQGLGRWALQWVDSDCSLANLDVRLLMWNVRRNLQPQPMPPRRVVVEFLFPKLEAQGRYWLIVAPGQPVDLCSIHPGGEVDVLVTADLRAMTSAWMGLSAFSHEVAGGRISVDGERDLVASFGRWIGRSGLAAATDR